MGLQSSALTLGGALGSPVIGTVVDHLGAGGGFAAAGLGGVLIAVLALPLTRSRGPFVPDGATVESAPVTAARAG
jgi:predicted MFS family arabinose efflux permease